MSISNTERLKQPRVDLANTGLRAYHLPTGEKNDLADYFGIGVRTCERWFAAQGEQYRRCIPRRAWTDEVPAGSGKFGWRVVQMFDADNPYGVGDARPALKGGGDIQHLRFRSFLAICLGVLGGLSREPIFNGKQRRLLLDTSSLSETLDILNSIYCGSYSEFMHSAWVALMIDARNAGGWRLTVVYNDPLPGEVYNEEETPEEDEDEEDE